MDLWTRPNLASLSGLLLLGLLLGVAFAAVPAQAAPTVAAQANFANPSLEGLASAAPQVSDATHRYEWQSFNGFLLRGGCNGQDKVAVPAFPANCQDFMGAEATTVAAASGSQSVNLVKAGTFVTPGPSRLGGIKLWTEGVTTFGQVTSFSFQYSNPQALSSVGPAGRTASTTFQVSFDLDRENDGVRDNCITYYFPSSILTNSPHPVSAFGTAANTATLAATDTVTDSACGAPTSLPPGPLSTFTRAYASYTITNVVLQLVSNYPDPVADAASGGWPATAPVFVDDFSLGTNAAVLINPAGNDAMPPDDGLHVQEGTPCTAAQCTDQASVSINKDPGVGTVTVTPTCPAEITCTPASFAFDTTNWGTRALLTIKAPDDSVSQASTHQATIAWSVRSTSPTYVSVVVPPTQVKIDEIAAALVITPSTALVSTTPIPTTGAGCTASFMVHLSTRPTSSVTVSLTSNLATQGKVTTPASTSLSFLPSNYNTDQTVTVTDQACAIDDGPQTFDVTATATTTGPGADPAYNYPTNPAMAPKVFFSNPDTKAAKISLSGPASVIEGTLPGVTSVTFTVTRDIGDTSDIKFHVDLSSGASPSATLSGAGADIGTPSSSNCTGTTSLACTFPASATAGATLTITVPIARDALDELDEPFTATLSCDLPCETTPPGDVDATVGTAAVTTTILDDDQAILTINNLAVAEGAPAVFTVTASTSADRDITVQFATSDGPTPAAVAGSDYTGSTGTLTLAAGTTTGTITVTTLDDVLNEVAEMFTITLSTPTIGGSPAPAGTLGASTGIGTINDNDAQPSLAISGAPVLVEGNTGTVPATFTVTLSAPSGRTVTVAYTTVDATATSASGDYVAQSGTLTFAPGGALVQTLTINVNGDYRVESTESFDVVLSAPSGATISTAIATATIQDDDVAGFVISTTAISGLTESLGVSHTGTFTVRLSSDPTASVTVSVTASLPADATAAPASLLFTRGSCPAIGNWCTPQTVTVTAVDDVVDDGAISSTVALAANNAATEYNGIMASVAVTTVDNDIPGLSIADLSLAEGDSGFVNFAFQVTLDRASTSTITVDYTTGVVATDPAVAGPDFTSTSGTLSFAPGETTKSVVVPVIGDLLDENDEGFKVTLSNPAETPATENDVVLIDALAFGTILDNDATPALSIVGGSVIEARNANTQILFTVNLDAASGKTVEIDFTTSDGPAPAATGGLDYTAVNVHFVFPPGVVQRTLAIVVAGDALDEPTEYFTAALSNPINAVLGSRFATGAIIPDVPPVAGISPGTTDTQVGVSVSFVDASTDSDGIVAAYAWDFGDGSVSALRSPQHAYRSPGPFTVTLTVTDNLGASASTTTNLNVHTTTDFVPAATPPAATPAGFTGATVDAGADQAAAAGDIVTLHGLANGQDGGFAFNWTQTSGLHVDLVDALTSTPTFTAPKLEPGASARLVFQLRVSDNGRPAGSDTVVVLVTQSVSPPTVSAGATQSVVTGDIVRLLARGTDPQGLTLTFNWTQTAGTPVLLSGATSGNASFTVPDQAAGEALAFRVVASNGFASASDSVQVLASKAPVPDPVVLPGNQTVAKQVPVRTSIAARVHQGAPAPELALVAAALVGLALLRRRR